MQSVSNGDNLQEMPLPIFWKKKKKNIFKSVCWKVLPNMLNVNVK